MSHGKCRFLLEAGVVKMLAIDVYANPREDLTAGRQYIYLFWLSFVKATSAV
jgi:hypothetical protein